MGKEICFFTRLNISENNRSSVLFSLNFNFFIWGVITDIVLKLICAGKALAKFLNSTTKFLEILNNDLFKHFYSNISIKRKFHVFQDSPVLWSKFPIQHFMIFSFIDPKNKQHELQNETTMVILNYWKEEKMNLSLNTHFALFQFCFWLIP